MSVKRITATAFLAVFLGIFAQEFLFPSFNFSVFLLFISLSSLPLFFIFESRLFLLVSLLLLLASFAAAQLYFQQDRITRGNLFISEYKAKDILAIVDDNPQDRGKYELVSLKLCDGSDCFSVMGKVYDNSNIQYGDRVLVKGIFYNPENFDYNFNYKEFLHSKGKVALLNIEDLKVLDKNKNFLSYLFTIKNTLLSNMRKSYGKDEAALAQGISLGAKESLSYELEDAFQKTGLMHIVVLSGFNITVLALLMEKIFFLFSKRVRLILSILSVTLFVLMVGPDAPTVRAAFMGILAYLALFFRREVDILHIFFLTAILMSIYNPLTLVYDPGFQMSFAATLGIILYANYIDKFLSLIPYQFMRDILSASLVAFVFASPFISYYMGTLSFVSIPANALVLPLVAPAMFLVYTQALFATMFASAPLIITALADILLKYILFFARFFAKFDFLIFNAHIPARLLFAISFLFLCYIIIRYEKFEN